MKGQVKLVYTRATVGEIKLDERGKQTYKHMYKKEE